MKRFMVNALKIKLAAKQQIKEFIEQEDGLTFLEYLILAIVIVGIGVLIKDWLYDLFQNTIMKDVSSEVSSLFN